MLHKLHGGFVVVCRCGTGLAFGGLIVAVLVQVAGRSVFNASPPWTEELTRFTLLWLVAFGTGLSLRTGDLVNVDLFCESLPGRAPWVLRVISAILTAAFCIALFSSAWFYASIGYRQTSPVLGVRMDFIFVSIFVLLGVLAAFALMRVAAMITGRSDGLPQGNGEDPPQGSGGKMP